MMISSRKRITLLCTLLVVFLFSACSTESMESMESRKQKLVSQNDAYSRSVSKTSKYERVMSKHFRVNLRKAPAYLAVRNVCKKLNIPFDTTFRPERGHSVTSNFNGTFEEFLSMVDDQSGVRYKYQDGLVSVMNKKLLEEERTASVCKDDENSVKISLSGVSPLSVFKYFSDKFGYSFRFENKLVSLDPENNNNSEKSLPSAKNVSFFYNGCDIKEALFSFGKANDFKISKTGEKRYKVQDYETAMFDVPVYLDVLYRSRTGANTNGDTAETSTSYKEKYKNELMGFIRQNLSKYGKVYVSSRGYVVVNDRPSYVEKIKRIINRERGGQQPLSIEFTIVRVDVYDRFESGVDWSGILSGSTFGLGSSFSGAYGGRGASFSLTRGDKSFAIKLLGEYGTSRIVKSGTIKARSGLLSSFKATEKIPYVKSSITVVNGEKLVSVEDKYAEAGIIVNMLPTLTDAGSTVNISTDISLASFDGYEEFDVNGGKYRIPKTSANKIQMPITVPVGKTVAITGLKMKDSKSLGDGLPGIKNNDLFSMLFGSTQKGGGTSEFIILITPKKTRR